MATVQNNDIIKGLSGMFGNAIIFRQLHGKTIVSPKPQPPKKQSDLQRKNRDKFREATNYAQNCMQDPDKKEYYKRKAKKLKLPNAYTAAITDFMRQDGVKKINRFGSRKDDKQTLAIQTQKKDFDSGKMRVTIKDEQGVVLQKSNAQKLGDNQFRLVVNKDIDLDKTLLFVEIENHFGQVVYEEVNFKAEAERS